MMKTHEKKEINLPLQKKMKHLKRDEVCASENKIKHSKKPQKNLQHLKEKTNQKISNPLRVLLSFAAFDSICSLIRLFVRLFVFLSHLFLLFVALSFSLFFIIAV